MNILPLTDHSDVSSPFVAADSLGRKALFPIAWWPISSTQSTSWWKITRGHGLQVNVPKLIRSWRSCTSGSCAAVGRFVNKYAKRSSVSCCLFSVFFLFLMSTRCIKCPRLHRCAVPLVSKRVQPVVAIVGGFVGMPRDVDSWRWPFPYTWKRSGLLCAGGTSSPIALRNSCRLLSSSGKANLVADCTLA